MNIDMFLQVYGLGKFLTGRFIVVHCANFLRCVKDWVRNGPSLRYAKKKF